MAESTPASVTCSEVDPFTPENIRNAWQLDGELRDAAPAVWLTRYGCYFVGRHKAVRDILPNWRAFSSTAKPFDDPDSVIPGILVTDDPPQHTRHRKALMQFFTPQYLERYRQRFSTEAAILVDQAIAARTLDGASELVEPFVLKVFPDIIGLPEEGRAHLLPFGEAVFNSVGPPNSIYHASMQRAQEAFAWVNNVTRRDSVSPDGLAADIYRLTDDGTITDSEAELLVRTVLAAGFDTTILAMNNALHAFSQFPAQWVLVHENPSLLRPAFEELLRYDPPARIMQRAAIADVDIAGVSFKSGDKIALFLSAAGRDPREWSEPNVFNLTRKAAHVGFGAGIHACIGQTFARLEFDCLFRELAHRAKALVLNGKAERLINNGALGWKCVPLGLETR